jgi:hypothetical protein
MTDPQDALELFQRALRDGILKLRRCSLDQDLRVAAPHSRTGCVDTRNR